MCSYIFICFRYLHFILFRINNLRFTVSFMYKRKSKTTDLNSLFCQFDNFDNLFGVLECSQHLNVYLGLLLSGNALRMQSDVPRQSITQLCLCKNSILRESLQVINKWRLCVELGKHIGAGTFGIDFHVLFSSSSSHLSLIT